MPKPTADMVAAVFRTIFAQPDARRRQRHLGRGPRPARRPVPQDRPADGRRQSRGPRLHRASPGALAKIWSTNPLERLNKEIKRRSRVVGIFPNAAAVIRLVGAVLADIHDEWQPSTAATSPKASMAQLYPDSDNEDIAAIDSGE